MRIAIFAEYYYPFISGVTTHIETLSKGLEAAGHKVLIVTLDPAAAKHYYKGNILYCPAKEVKRVYGYGISNPFNRLRVKLIRRFRPDVLHMQTEFTMGLFALRCARQLNKPLVYTLHTMYDDYAFYVVPKLFEKAAAPILHAYIRQVAGRAGELIGPSHKVADYLRLCGVRRRVNVVPNTVDTNAFLSENVDDAKIKAAKAEFGIHPGDTALCFVSRIGKEKSIGLLISWFAQSFAGQERFKLFIIGDGPEREALQRQVEQLGIGSQIRLTGRIEHDELPAYYQACDLFATASLTEMNSISLIEANASGLYAAHRLDADNLDQIEAGINGEFFETREQFETIVRQHAKLTKAAKAKRKKQVVEYAKRYGPSQFTQATLKIYRKAIDAHHNSVPYRRPQPPG